ncbi:MAG: hypothetical protein KDC98_07645 [Planctomycetes bacterium]|nr:hypothetical protein [Planctomycetota bacterium]
MKLLDTALAVIAIVGAGSLWDRTSTVASDDLEVVYSYGAPAFGCNGCKPVVHDSLGTGLSYVCPNGDIWTLTIESPIATGAECVAGYYSCLLSGSCTFKQTATLTYDPAGGGGCGFYFNIGHPTIPTGQVPAEVSLGTTEFVLESIVLCRNGALDEEDCEEHRVELYDNPAGGTPAIVWHVKHCCGRCPTGA